MDTRQSEGDSSITGSGADEEEGDVLSGGCASYDREYLRSDEDRSSMWGEERSKCRYADQVE